MTLLELCGVTKRYGDTTAVADVSMQVARGQIHAVLGQNGAGKSTLMKIINGAVQADSGEIRWAGRRVYLTTPAAARRIGIGMVYQHFTLFDSLSVVDNVAVALDDRYDPKRLAGRIVELAERYGLHVDPWRELHRLSVGERQRVEILRCLLQRPSLLILDEPTAVLTPQGISGLFEVLRKLAAEGCSIVYISHKLDEVRDLCDFATILRDGRVVASAVPRETSSAELARAMVVTDLPAVRRPAGAAARAPVRLEVQNLPGLREVSLRVGGGEIVGIAGVSGNGQAVLADAIVGHLIGPAETVRLDGRSVGHLGVAARRALGLAYVPEDRLGRGAVPGFNLAENALLTAHAHGLVRRGFVSRTATRRFAEDIIDRFDVKCRGPLSGARSLSGGNLQKFIVGREMSLAPRVLLVAQPTWGVDVAAAARLRQSLLDLSRRGVAVLVISEDLEELFQICDRIAVLSRQTLSPAQAVGALDAAQVGLAMSGT